MPGAQRVARGWRPADPSSPCPPRTALIGKQGFPRAARLLSATDFRRVFTRPIRVADARFTVLALSGRQGPARLGLAISKKHVRRAVQRNRLKRLVREVFRRKRYELDGLDLVVMARSGAAEADNAELRASLERLLQKLHARAAGG